MLATRLSAQEVNRDGAVTLPSNATRDYSPEELQVVSAALPVIDALNQRKLEVALAFMTERGFADFCGQQFTSMLQLGLQENAAEKNRELNDIAKKYGFHRVDLSSLQSVELSIQNLKGESLKEAILDAQLKMESLALSAVPVENRKQALLEVTSALAKVVIRPEEFVLMGVNFNDEECEVAVGMAVNETMVAKTGSDGLPTDTKGIDDTRKQPPAMRLRFIRQGDAWMFDGFDKKKMIDDMQGFDESVTMLQLIEGFDVSGTVVDGSKVALSDYQGKVVLVDFWGTWCTPCRESLPELQELYAEFHEQGFEILGVAGDSTEKLADFLKSTPLPWKNIVDEEMSIAEQYSIEEFPRTLLIDREGKHVATNLQRESLKLAIKPCWRVNDLSH